MEKSAKKSGEIRLCKVKTYKGESSFYDKAKKEVVYCKGKSNIVKYSHRSVGLWDSVYWMII